MLFLDSRLFSKKLKFYISILFLEIMIVFKKKCLFYFYCDVYIIGIGKSRWSKEYSKEGVGWCDESIRDCN